MGKTSSFTFQLWEPGNTGRDDHKQFTDNPDLQVTYNDTPSVPGGLKETATATGSGSLDCDTSYSGPGSPLPPIMGKTASVSGPFLWATYNDRDGDEVSSTIDYWVYGNTANGGTATAGSDLALQVTGVDGVPSANVTAVAVNLTAVGETSSGAIVAYPGGSALPGHIQPELRGGRRRRQLRCSPGRCLREDRPP